MQLRILNSLGVEVQKRTLPAGIKTEKFDLGAYTPGLYFIIIEDKGRIVYRQGLMKQ